MIEPIQILIVSNNVDQSQSSKNILEKTFDCIVEIADDSKKCLVRLEQKKIDIVLLDYLLSYQDGLTILQMIIKNKKNVKVIMLINQDYETVAIESLKLGAYDFIVKTSDYLTKLPLILKKAIDYKKLENQLIQSEKLCALGQLVSGVAHELNNPLSGIIGFSKLLLSEISEEKYRKDLTTIHKEAVRCHKIMNNLLCFSREYISEKTPVDLNSVIESVLELRAFQFKRDNINIVKRFSNNLPKVYIDFHKFQQVFLNLITNAHQATLLTTEPNEIFIETTANTQIVKVKIIDNGAGIPENHISKLFDPFFTTKKPNEGTGLGLSICKDIIDQHNGKIYAENNKKMGATFIVELPIQKVSPDKQSKIYEVKFDSTPVKKSVKLEG